MIDINKILSQFKTDNLKEKAEGVREKMRAVRTKGESGGGLVSVEMNGLGRVMAVHVDDSLFVEQNKSVLCDLLVAAFNIAHKKMEEKTQNLAVSNLMDVLPSMLKES